VVTLQASSHEATEPPAWSRRSTGDFVYFQDGFRLSACEPTARTSSTRERRRERGGDAQGGRVRHSQRLLRNDHHLSTNTSRGYAPPRSEVTLLVPWENDSHADDGERWWDRASEACFANNVGEALAAFGTAC